MYIVKKGELIVGMDGDFKSAFWTGSDALLNQRVCKITPSSNYYSLKFLALVLPGYLDEINKHTSAVTVKHLSSNDIYEIPLSLPPFNEQVRIVGRVEELFSRLDAGVRSLQVALTRLEQYRQATLRQAYTGKLTQKWRLKQNPKTILAENLLRKIEEYRNENNLSKPRKLPPLNQNELYKLPNNWVWVLINDIVKELRYGTSSKADDNEKGIAVLRMGNIQDGKINYSDLKIYGPNFT
jgi:type I restriction enzyme S subunit